MIPFWKKTDKGGKKKPQKPAVPRTAQQSIPIQRMFEDGTGQIEGDLQKAVQADHMGGGADTV